MYDKRHRDGYNSAKTSVESLKQEDIKKTLSEKLSKVLEKVEELEEKAREEERIRQEKLRIEREKKEREEAERKKAISEAWVKLNAPYISQNRNKVYNGCEAASLLMALKYKGQLANMDIVTFATNMPKSDDPNTGFYLDIFGTEPKNVTHWIAPDPLAKYGVSSSGYENVINITGAGIDSIANEIINGNPVIIYLTYNYVAPSNWNNGVHKNLHVQLVIGYNKITGDFIIQDPWTRDSGQYQFTVAKSKINDVYTKVGSKAVVVR